MIWDDGEGGTRPQQKQRPTGRNVRGIERQRQQLSIYRGALGRMWAITARASHRPERHIGRRVRRNNGGERACSVRFPTKVRVIAVIKYGMTGESFDV